MAARTPNHHRPGSTTVRGVPCLVVKRLPPHRAETPASAFTVKLVEAMVAGQTAPDPAATVRAATFAAGQIRALPPEIRILFSCGIACFRFVTRLRFLRAYDSLPLDRRRGWTQRWTESRITPLRSLFKPMTATALLAYYDDQPLLPTEGDATPVFCS